VTDQQKKPEDGEDPAISSLYRATRIEEPSAELDAKILAEAKAVTQHRHRRWLLPVSSAAVVLLGVTLTLQLQDQVSRLPQTLEDFGAEIPAEMQADQRAAKKQVVPPAPALMMEPSSKRIEEGRAKLQKSAPGRSVTADSAFESLRERDEAEVLENSDQNQQAIELVENPAVWLQRIQNYLHEEDRSKAIAELKAFKSRYPDYPLSERLQTLELD
jgi:hypothetical protein